MEEATQGRKPTGNGWLRRAIFAVCAVLAATVWFAILALLLLPDPGAHGLGPMVNFMGGGMVGGITGVLGTVIALVRWRKVGPSRRAVSITVGALIGGILFTWAALWLRSLG